MRGDEDSSGWVRDCVRAFALESRTPAPPEDPDRLTESLRLATQSSLLGVVTHQLKLSGSTSPATLHATVTHLAMARLMQQVDLSSMAEALDRAGVRWMLIKGPVLDAVVYRVPHLRSYVDLDVLIHPADFELGWRTLQDMSATDLDLNWARLATTEQSEITLRLPHGSILDLHWHVISNKTVRAEFGLDVRLFFDDAITVTVGGTQVKALSPIDNVLYVALHAALSGGHELRWLLDLHQSLRWAGVPDAQLVRRAEQLHLSATTRVMLDRLRRWVGRPGSASSPIGSRWHLWFALCRAVDRLVPPVIGQPDTYSGRVVFASTRPRLSGSLVALITTGFQVVRAGRSRRHAVIDRSALSDPGGTEQDLAAWMAAIDRAASEAT